MLEMNLNILLTFFWLFLSSGILLLGIWLLIDCKINLRIINLILKNFYINNNDIPQIYFIHFYLIGIIINLILFLKNLSSFFLFLIFIIYISRQLYECLYIYKLNLNKKFNLIYYFFGFIYYPFVGLTIIIDTKYPYTSISLMKYFFALFIYINANLIQHNIHLRLAKLNSNYWIFSYVSSPNFLTEIFIYISFLIASHRTSAMTALFVWVFINQSLSALLKHRLSSSKSDKQNII